VIQAGDAVRIREADPRDICEYGTIAGSNPAFATIVRHFDLKEMGLAWQEWGQRHVDLVAEIDKTMMES
jgi:polar amino acid transport system ATP-binding protein